MKETGNWAYLEGTPVMLAIGFGADFQYVCADMAEMYTYSPAVEYSGSRVPYAVIYGGFASPEGVPGEVVEAIVAEFPQDVIGDLLLNGRSSLYEHNKHLLLLKESEALCHYRKAIYRLLGEYARPFITLDPYVPCIVLGTGPHDERRVWKGNVEAIDTAPAQLAAGTMDLSQDFLPFVYKKRYEEHIHHTAAWHEQARRALADVEY